MDEESSSSRGSINPEPGAEDPPATTPQDREEEDPHDIEMKDVEDDPNPPPPSEQDDDPLPVQFRLHSLIPLTEAKKTKRAQEMTEM